MENLNRRRFLGAAIGTGAAAAAAGGLAPAAGARGKHQGWGWGHGRGGSVPRQRIGIQLYSLRRVMTDAASAERMFSFLAKSGYTEVEPFGDSYGLTAKQLRRLLDRYRLKVPSRHDQDFNQLLAEGDGWKEDFKQRLEDANTLGQKYTGLAWFPGPYTEEYFKFLAERFTEAGILARKHGLQFFYHNHDFEFSNKQANGAPLYDILLTTDPDVLKLELDLYWIVVGGESPVHYLADDPARYPLYHVKDKTWRDRPDEQDWEDVGPGSIDFPDIFAAGEGRGLDKHFIVEHDWPLLSHPGDETGFTAEHKTSLAGVQYLRDVRW
jgi:sugar phosphate isomerase/epimerase